MMLDDSPQWVAWRLDLINGKHTKVPYNPHTHGKAMSNNPKTWGTRAQAEKACKAIGGNGIGLMFGRVQPCRN
jgi:putative DNA primase/helicase